MWVEYNVNPTGKSVGDCVIRALSAAMGTEWERTYLDMAIQGLLMYNMPSANEVWGEFLRHKGYRRTLPPEDCRTVADFCRMYPKGRYILALSEHVVAAINGDWYDIWDSGGETVIYIWAKEE